LGTNSQVRAITVQPDGKILVAGMLFIPGSGTPAGVIRLLSDGTLDGTFQRFSTDAMSLQLQPDGKVLVGGGQYAQQSWIVGLTPGGAVDQTFNTSGLSSGVFALGLQPSGAVIAGGYF